ncbi:MAG TPA: hypothetical protein VGL72_20350 [Bryobacteraceae bacterium]
MSQHFPISWEEWKEGTENLYLLKQILEARQAAGTRLTKEELSLLAAARKVAARYQRSGHKKAAETPAFTSRSRT